MKKKVDHKRKTVVTVVLLLIATAIVSIGFVSTSNWEHKEACKKWKEAKARNEQLKVSNPEIQQGVSIEQIQEMGHEVACQENR